MTVSKPTVRNEAEIFENLRVLVASPGYVHAIAQICIRDVFITYDLAGMKASDLEKLFSPSHLIRTEISSILGLLAQTPIDRSPATPAEVRTLIETTDRLMEELHGAMGEPARQKLMTAIESGVEVSSDELWRGDSLREPIFYGPESAYSFQYRDLASDKYGADDTWLLREKHFSITQAQVIAGTMCKLMDQKCAAAMAAIKRKRAAPSDLLAAFEQSIDEVSQSSGVPVEQVKAFFDAFTLRDGNTLFRSVGDFNAVNATPLLAVGVDRVLLFQHYSIYEAIYETPYYWLMADETYRPTAAAHRGSYTEIFAAKRLRKVFGASCVHINVQVVRNKGKNPGEIDVLVVFGDRLIVLQAKAKKLTLKARRGNDGALTKDFKGAIQDSYDQGLLCAQAIIAGDCKLVTDSGLEIKLPYPPKEIFIFNVVSDHYPALAFQARQSLRYQETEVIRPPFVMDVFLLDALTEMLESPLRLLSYVSLRVKNLERIAQSHELSALGFHLKRNLWIRSDYDTALLDDTMTMDLDLAMTVRREGVAGPRTPEGILTWLSGTLYERLLHQIERRAEPAILDFGLHLLTLGEDTARNIHHGLEFITRQARQDGKPHDFTIGDDGKSGFTFHCNPVFSETGVQKLEAMCELRKYRQRAALWFGVSVDPHADLQFGFTARSEWKRSADMDVATANMQAPQEARRLAGLALSGQRSSGPKVGRNERCPCGSGRKFKHCCLNSGSAGQRT